MKKENVTEKGTATKKRNQRKLGSVYEQAIGFYLEQQGYEIVAFNYRCPLGEIDLIAKDGEDIVFCEVKYRSGKCCGSAAEAVDRKKQKRIWRAALQYLTVNKMENIPCRFDVIGIEGGKISVIKNAFEGEASWI